MLSANEVDVIARCEGKAIYRTPEHAEQVIDNMLRIGRGAGKGNRLNVIKCHSHGARAVYHVGTTMRTSKAYKMPKYPLH